MTHKVGLLPKHPAQRFHVQNDAELAVLESLRDSTVTRFIVTKKGDEAILLESEQELPKGTDLNTAVSSHNFQTVILKRHGGQNIRISRTTPRKISRGNLVVDQLNNE